MATVKGKARKTATQRKSSQAAAPVPTEGKVERLDHRPAHADFRREIELVVKCAETGDIIARTGILVSPLEAHDIHEIDEYVSYFRFGFSPVEGCAPPEGCYWLDQQASWCSTAPLPFGGDKDKTLYRVHTRKDSAHEWSESCLMLRWPDAVEHAEKLRQSLKLEVMIEPAESQKPAAEDAA